MLDAARGAASGKGGGMTEHALKIRGRKPKGQGDDRRREILAAAREIFLAEGYEPTTIRRVGDRVGVSSTALYVYFKDKNALIAGVCDEILAPLHAAAMDLRQRAGHLETGAEVERALRSFAEEYIRFGLANPVVYFRIFMDRKQVVFDHRTGKYENADESSNNFNLFAFGVDMIGRGQELGVFRAGDPIVLTEVAWACIHGLTAIRVTDPQAPYAPVNDHIEACLNMVMAGLKA